MSKAVARVVSFTPEGGMEITSIIPGEPNAFDIRVNRLTNELVLPRRVGPVTHIPPVGESIRQYRLPGFKPIVPIPEPSPNPSLGLVTEVRTSLTSTIYIIPALPKPDTE